MDDSMATPPGSSRRLGDGAWRALTGEVAAGTVIFAGNERKVKPRPDFGPAWLTRPQRLFTLNPILIAASSRE
jgi:hypothetical protein